MGKKYETDDLANQSMINDFKKNDNRLLNTLQYGQEKQQYNKYFQFNSVQKGIYD